ncbi:putative serine-threonine protein kinase [Aspergillus indologenus CBS 114.80]|uniref:Putative serine-threonine protein kinase n=1 Tax=Aspergillus indologenus CBS 114.80 TaxID=1450541 RepID=A0A2V5ITZ8_9EURO|nr:putative serine-threonine protein kinase [Aspergillus indologenus CBS 114.80]
MACVPSIVPSQIVAVGSVSSIHTFGSDHVLKRSPPSLNEFARQAFDIEVRAYKRLGNHRRIAVLSDVTSEGIVLERGECLRKIIQSPGSGKITMRTRLRWAQEASEGLCYIHSKSIIHADVGCHNLILDQSGHIRFIDFAGSGIDGEPPMVCYETCASRGDSAPTEKTDIFAFGSALFEIESGHVPYHELCDTMEIFQALRAAEQRYAMGEYPNMESSCFRHVITKCWDGTYSSMFEVERDLCSLELADDDDNPCPAWEMAS